MEKAKHCSKLRISNIFNETVCKRPKWFEPLDIPLPLRAGLQSVRRYCKGREWILAAGERWVEGREGARGSRFGNLVGLVGRGDERKTASKKMESASRRILTAQ